MSARKTNSAAVEAAKIPTKEESAKRPDAAHHFAVNPNDVTSVVNGNTVLFLGKGVREITVTSD